MGKITTKDSREQTHRAPLYKDITQQDGVLKTRKKNKKQKRDLEAEEDATEEHVLDAASSRKVLQLAREQQEEIEGEENDIQASTAPRFQIISRDSDDEEEDDEEFEGISDNEEEYYDDDEEVEEIDEADAALFESYFKQNSAPFGSFNLADKVMAKIYEKQNELQQQQQGDKMERPQDKVFLPPRVIEAYEMVGQSLRAWRHGKLPKLFKVLPTIKNWEDLIYVTQPESWTPQVVYEATKLFVSNLSANKAERFVNLILLPRFRMDIEESDEHKLNYHLYRSLKKSLYKPAAFFKGFLFPLIEDDCTTREAMIVGSILTKNSIPVQHSSVALSWLLEQEFTPATTVFIRILVEKKYALPYQTIDDIVFYFMRFRIITDQTKGDIILEDNHEIAEQRRLKQAPPMPLVWHKAFLAFAQRYKNDITEDQKDFLMEVIRQRGHKDIGPEIRRELNAGKQREIAVVEPVKDDIMAYF
ncbi:hypothetical protein CANARDRAFT_204570 [[Candida] arabinofermentans NRRL YB-2248]|uniref:Uncharacterized protein n=1 Tax=[Candida] arabinofermentans NRRL YB-2248 TaxID=983967 RepID=A0A1E4STD1_9ASCO|nr:hypothetical protein CANARDRAFT_204570 [[Candida] arabinofermentans NRRL YB-2248]